MLPRYARCPSPCTQRIKIEQPVFVQNASEIIVAASCEPGHGKMWFGRHFSIFFYLTSICPKSRWIIGVIDLKSMLLQPVVTFTFELRTVCLHKHPLHALRMLVYPPEH